jgi:hypothetical protein
MPEDRDIQHADEVIEDLRTALRHLTGVFDQTLEGYKGFGAEGIELRRGEGELSAFIPTAKSNLYCLTISITTGPSKPE